MSTANGVALPKRSDSLRPSFGNAGSLDALFNPKTVAILGANEQPAAMGHRILSNFLSSEFAGSTFIVQPGQSSVLGHHVYPSLSAVPSKVELAVAVTSPEAAPEVLAECVEQNVKGVILVTSGFGAKGADPTRAAERMRAVLKGARTRVIGPNTLGVMNPLIGLNATPDLHMPAGRSLFSAKAPSWADWFWIGASSTLWASASLPHWARCWM
jgi:acyl-CoA synthetase (NDP forming)